MRVALAAAVLEMALRTLRMHKLRTLLTMLGVIIGVAAVLAMIAIGSGAQAKIKEQIKSLGSNLLLLIPGSVTSGGTRLGARSRASLTEGDALAIQAEIPEVELAAPAVHGAGHVVAGNTNWATVFHGVTPDYLYARRWLIAHGEGFTASDMAGAGKVVLLGETAASSLFGHQDPIGQTVRVGQVPMVVVGVLQRRGQNLSGQDQDDVVVMPLSTARNRVLGGNAARQRAVHTIVIKVRDGASMSQAEDAIRSLLRQRHRIQAGREDDFLLRNLSQVAEAEEESTRVMTMLLASIAGVSLLVGGIGIMNIMLVSVRERTREIGIRRAVGARKADILSQFLLEALTLAVAGGVCGAVVGLGSAYALARLTGWPMEIGAEAVALAFGFAAAVGIIFGIYPARQASRLPPMDALRCE